MTVLGWHFLSQSGTLRGSTEKVEAGKVYRVELPLRMCAHGLHGSRRLIDALGYAPGPIACRDEFGGVIEEGDDKLVAETRTAIWMYDASAVLHEFACRCAEDALALVDQPDPRSVEAIRVKRLWLAGKATDEELADARYACPDGWHAWNNLDAFNASPDAWANSAAAWAARVEPALAATSASKAARNAAAIAWGNPPSDWGNTWFAVWDAKNAANAAARAAQNRRLTAMISRNRGDR